MHRTENLATSLKDRRAARAELALEFVLQKPYGSLRKEAAEAGWEEEELLQAGQRIFEDLARLEKGTIDVLRVPERLQRLISHTPPPALEELG